MYPHHIKRVSIYPPLGLARLGNSEAPDGWFLATQVRGRPPQLPTSLGGPGRDDDGRILRQAVLFHVYAELDDGRIVEVTAGDQVSITWEVTVANLKAGWYQFLQAMDLPADLVKSAERRNALVSTGRGALDITPSTRRISSKDPASASKVFDDGTFFGKPVYLGELRIDSFGRLLFLGGRGESASRVPGNKPETFANNDDWHDDVCDGPVRATVEIQGQRFEAEPGYVAVAPPNYAPGLFGVVTMEDAVTETWIDAGWIERPVSTSFTYDVWPIFDRLSQMSWVNSGIHIALGSGSPLDARDEMVVGRMRNAAQSQKAWRARVFDLFLPPGASVFDSGRIPQIFGDAYGEADGSLAMERLSVTSTMYLHLQRWRDGDFQDDWPGSIPLPMQFDELTASEQVHHLERAALYECLGGPFHPGIELTWSLRDRRQWQRPYRLAINPENNPARQDFGELLTRAECLADGGPLEAVAPGCLTRWLGVPWQTDEASCNSERDYAPSLYLSMPSFWGARVPDQVLSAEGWSRVQDGQAPALQRRKHFDYREDWLRDIRGRNYQERISAMVTHWWQLGIVAPQTPADESMPDGLNRTAWVETGRPGTIAGSNEKLRLVAKIERLDSPGDIEAGLEPAAIYHPPHHRYGRGEV